MTAPAKSPQNLVGYPLPNSAAPLEQRLPAALYGAQQGQALVGRPEGSPRAPRKRPISERWASEPALPYSSGLGSVADDGRR